jgi:hypothetical protein
LFSGDGLRRSRRSSLACHDRRRRDWVVLRPDLAGKIVDLAAVAAWLIALGSLVPWLG